MGENICKLCKDKRLTVKLCKELIELSSKKKKKNPNNPNLKNRQRNGRDIFPRKIQRRPIGQENMFNIPNLQGSTSQNTKRHRLTPVRTATSKPTNNKCWQGCGERGAVVLFFFGCSASRIIFFYQGSNLCLLRRKCRATTTVPPGKCPCALLMGMQIIAAATENAVEVPQKKLNMELPYDPAIPLLGVYSKAMDSQPQRDICTPAASSMTAEAWKPPECLSTDGCTKKPCYKHTVEYYSAIRKKGY